MPAPLMNMSASATPACFPRYFSKVLKCRSFACVSAPAFPHPLLGKLMKKPSLSQSKYLNNLFEQG
jgi:hypothetical protein